MTGYTRQSTYTNGDVITAAHTNDEFDQLETSFDSSSGHAHDGTAGEGPVIKLIGDPGNSPVNKVEIDTTNNRVGFYIDVSSVSTEQIRVQDGVVVPVTTNDVDLGTSSLQFKDLYLDGTATIDGLAMPTTTVTDILDEDTMSSDSATALATQQSIKAYVDAQVTAQDLDFQGDSGGALNIDLDSETLTIAGGTGIDTTGSGNTLTVDIDSTVATLTGTQTLTNKTLTTPVISTISNTGTITLPTSTDTLVGRATTDTLTNKTLTSAVLNGTISGTSIKDEDDMLSDSASHLATQQSIKAYVDAQVTAQDLDFQADSGGALSIDLDSETMTFTGGTGIDTVGSLNDVTFSIDSTVATLTGTQTLTNKTLTSAVLNTGVSGTAILDEDNMASNSDTQLATQQSIKAYVDAQIAGIDEVVEDTTPQLGGNLDVNGNKITSASNGDIDIEPNGTGNVLLGNFEFDVDQTVGAGQDNYVLTYDNSTGHISLEAAAAGGISDVVSDTTPQLGGELDSNSNDIKMADDDVVILGTDSDALLSHDSANNRTRFATDDIVVSSKSGANPYLEMRDGGNTVFYYNGTQTASIVSTGIIVVGNVNTDSVTVDNQGTVSFFEQTGNGTNSVALKAPASVTTSIDFVLPGSDGTSGQAIVTDGAGNLSFATPTAAGDGDGLAFAIALG